MKKGYMLIVLAIICTLIVGYNETHYIRTGYISNIDNNEITIEDNTGNEWVWINDDNISYEINQPIKMKMDNNCSDNYIYDDIILSIK